MLSYCLLSSARLLCRPFNYFEDGLNLKLLLQKLSPQFSGRQIPPSSILPAILFACSFLSTLNGFAANSPDNFMPPNWVAGKTVVYDCKLYRNGMLARNYRQELAVIMQGAPGYWLVQLSSFATGVSPVAVVQLAFPPSASPEPSAVLELLENKLNFLGLPTGVQQFINYQPTVIYFTPPSQSAISSLKQAYDGLEASGTETITTTAGTFSTSVYGYPSNNQAPNHTVELKVWANGTVPLTGVVKYSKKYNQSNPGPKLQDEIDLTLLEIRNSSANSLRGTIQQSTPPR